MKGRAERNVVSRCGLTQENKIHLSVCFSMCDSACLLLSCGDKGAEAVLGCQCDFTAHSEHTHTNTYLQLKNNTYISIFKNTKISRLLIPTPLVCELPVSPLQLSPLLQISIECLFHELASTWPAGPEPIRVRQTRAEQETV